MSTNSEKILNDAVHGRKMLQMGGRLEAAHLALALSNRLARDVRAVVGVAIRAVN